MESFWVDQHGEVVGIGGSNGEEGEKGVLRE